MKSSRLFKPTTIYPIIPMYGIDIMIIVYPLYRDDIGMTR